MNMHCLLKSKCASSSLQRITTQKIKNKFYNSYCTERSPSTEFEVSKLCSVVTNGIGSLDDLESSLNRCEIDMQSSIVTQVIDSCKNEAPTRRLLRFFSWSINTMNCDLGDEEFNHVIKVFAEKKDFTAIEILISDLVKENRAMEAQTFGVVAETYVKLGRENEALGLFKNLEKFKCLKDQVTVTSIVQALCLKGHAKQAEGVVWHHKDKISGVEACIYKSLLYGWTKNENVKEARKTIKEMKHFGIKPDLYCFNTLLECTCKKNLKNNPSGLVPEALNVMIEMRTHGIAPTSISYNILLSCLVEKRRVKESLQILETMKNSNCSPDWVTYYLVTKVLYLTERFGKGNQMVDKMIEEELTPDRKFYYDLIGVLCGVERVNFALELFDKMKKSSLGGYGKVYYVLIPKLCKNGEFEKCRELFDEAVLMGVSLSFSRGILDPKITEVFAPTRKVEDDVLLESKQTQKFNAVEKKRMLRRFKMKKRYIKKKFKKRKKVATTSN